MRTKFIITTGGVISGLGKGIVSSSMGRLLKAAGYKVTIVKIDPYLNVDAGTMNPFEHGEVFVLDDGGECDMDLGNYERFLNVSLTKDNNITTGKVYKIVIDKERRGSYLGKTVQIIPHITREIYDLIKKASEGFEICIVEVGGTVGDIESMPFLEAARQMHLKEGDENVAFVHVTLVPSISVVGEQKTKPTQHSVQRLQESGIQPDFIVCRAPKNLNEKTKEKIADFCNVHLENVFSDPDCRSLYEVPLVLQEEGLDKKIMEKFGLKKKDGDGMGEWRKTVKKMLEPKDKVKVVLAGKYTALSDSYISILESLKHAGAANDCEVEVFWAETTDFEKDRANLKLLDDANGLIVPGGWGERGVEGKIMAVQHARENSIPFLGLCYGFQMAAIEFARNMCGLKKANTTEVDPKTPHPVVVIQPDQLKIKDMGGTLRLGSWPCKIQKNTLAWQIYGKELVHERHRHRYELNPDYIKRLEENGLVFSGKSPDTPIMEMLELPGHPFFLGAQFHPELKSRVEAPAPVFVGFIKACLARKLPEKKG